MPVNNKILQRAISKLLVNDTSDVIKLVQKYNPDITKNISYADLLLAVLDLLETNIDFANEFGQLLLKKRRLSDYNNANSYSNAIAADPVSAIAGAVKSIFDLGAKIGEGKDRQLAQNQLNSQNTQQIMQFMMADEQTREAAKSREANLIYLAIGSLVVITGIIIFMKKK
jgi:hypothetical protein